MAADAMLTLPAPKSPSVLVTVCDSADLVGAKQLFTAAVTKGLWEGDKLLLGYRLDAPSKDWFDENGVRVVDAEPAVPTTICITKEHRPSSGVCLIKAHLFSSVFRQWETVVYMDTDVLIRGSIKKIENVGGFSAVTDNLLWVKDHFEPGTVFGGRLPGFKKYSRGFNAGVFAFKPKRLPSDTFDRFREIAEEFAEYAIHSDQSFMNLLFVGRWEKLPDEFNALDNMYRRFRSPFILRVTDRARVLHFAGKNKPSFPENRHAGEWLENISNAQIPVGPADIRRSIGPEDVAPGWKVELAYRYLRLRKWLLRVAREVEWGIIGFIRPE